MEIDQILLLHLFFDGAEHQKYQFVHKNIPYRNGGFSYKEISPYLDKNNDTIRTVLVSLSHMKCSVSRLY